MRIRRSPPQADEGGGAAWRGFCCDVSRQHNVRVEYSVDFVRMHFKNSVSIFFVLKILCAIFYIETCAQSGFSVKKVRTFSSRMRIL